MLVNFTSSRLPLVSYFPWDKIFNGVWAWQKTWLSCRSETIKFNGLDTNFHTNIKFEPVLRNGQRICRFKTKGFLVLRDPRRDPANAIAIIPIFDFKTETLADTLGGVGVMLWTLPGERSHHLDRRATWYVSFCLKTLIHDQVLEGGNRIVCDPEASLFEAHIEDKYPFQTPLDLEPLASVALKHSQKATYRWK